MESQESPIRLIIFAAGNGCQWILRGQWKQGTQEEYWEDRDAIEAERRGE